MKSSKLLSILAVAGAIVFSASVEAAQPAATGQRGQEGGGIAKLLMGQFFKALEGQLAGRS